MKKIIVSIFLIAIVSLLAQTNFTFMTYNALKFPDEYGEERLEYFQEIFDQVEPDILVMQEIQNTYGAMDMLALLNNQGEYYSRSQFVSNGDMSSVLFYKHDIVSLLEQDVIDAWPRDHSEFHVEIDGIDFYIYSCHLKAGSTGDDEEYRLTAVTSLREHLSTLPSGSEFIIAGDMNFYEDSEPAYQKFTGSESDNTGRCFDLCPQVGNWHENQSFAEVHSQSPRTNQFWGGIGGGLDDRFDFIFGNYSINNGSNLEYVEDSYQVFGNDGEHYNQSVNDGYNSAVAPYVADALYYASDHLPVIADFTISDQSITVLYPNGGETFESNQSVEILWESVNISDPVTIELWNNENVSQILVENYTNSESWLWNVSEEIPNGNSYRIHLAPSSGSPFDFSDTYFSIGSNDITNAFFLSEYVEGSSYNKALELFNGTGQNLSLVGYSIKKQTNGSGEFGSEFSLSGSLENNSTFVICHPSSEETILDLADATSSVCNFNGNDAIGLFFDGQLIDLIGVIDSADDWGKDVTLIRKNFINSPSNVYNVDDWDEYPQNTFDNLGYHDFEPISSDGDVISLPISDFTSFPNPFNPSTTIQFTLNKPVKYAEIMIFNSRGQIVWIKKLSDLSIGQHQYNWNGENNENKPVTSGIYLAKIEIDQKIVSKKMLLLK